MEWTIRHEVAGASVQRVTYEGRTSEFAVFPTQIFRRGPQDQDLLVHEAYRKLLEGLRNNWEPTVAYHTQMLALMDQPPQGYKRWGEYQVADVSVFTEDPLARSCLTPFFNLASDPRSASLHLVGPYTAPLDDLSMFLGRIFRYCISATGTLQVWDARLPFAVTGVVSAYIHTPVLAHALALVVHGHLTSFLLNKSFVEVHPNLTVTRITYD